MRARWYSSRYESRRSYRRGRRFLRALPDCRSRRHAARSELRKQEADAAARASPHGHAARDLPALRERLVALRNEIHKAAQAQMVEMVGSDEKPYEVDFKVVEGLPAQTIPLAARDLGASVLAVGTHARRGVRRLLKGSVVESMLHRLHLPTLVFAVGDDQIPPEAELSALTHATVALDTHDGAELVARRALKALTDLAAMSSRKPAVTLMTVVHVEGAQLSPDVNLIAEVEGMVHDSARARLAPLKAEFDAAGFQCAIEIRTGTIEDEILAVAATEPSQLIVMGTHGEGDVWLDFSSTAADVIRHANVTVFVLPSHRALHETE